MIRQNDDANVYIRIGWGRTKRLVDPPKSQLCTIEAVTPMRQTKNGHGATHKRITRMPCRYPLFPPPTPDNATLVPSLYSSLFLFFLCAVDMPSTEPLQAL